VRDEPPPSKSHDGSLFENSAGFGNPGFCCIS
jgi:hypothetical protein